MAISIVNNTTSEQNFKFLPNQSSILLNSDTNKVTINGVNVIVNKPKKGDVMFVNDGQVIWIDGLSINPALLSTEFEPVGICVVAYDNKAIVRYKQENNLKLLSSNITVDERYLESDLYLNNGFCNNMQRNPRQPGCCRAQLLDNINKGNITPTSNMLNIFEVPGKARMPVCKTAFDDNPFCEILRNNFATYDDYIDSMMIKIPCGKGSVGKFKSGKEITYKLFDSATSPAKSWVEGIDINAPKLEAGNWYIPSALELGQIMRDITYGTTFWNSADISLNTDIVNRVLFKLNQFDSRNWSMISGWTQRWTCSLYNSNQAFIYEVNFGTFGVTNMTNYNYVMAITTYEF